MANFLKKLPEEIQRKWFEFKNLFNCNWLVSLTTYNL
jgi:hypothetical protein